MILYWPSLSVTTLRVFSISAGLEASTVTPGTTAPDASLTSPAMPLVAAWDHATSGIITTDEMPRMTDVAKSIERMLPPQKTRFRWL